MKKHKKLKPKIVKLNENQLYFMTFQSAWREYIAFGTDLRKMAENILAKYNSFCEVYDRFDTLEEFARENKAQCLDYAFLVYIVDINSAMETEQCVDNYLGDYFEMF